MRSRTLEPIVLALLLSHQASSQTAKDPASQSIATISFNAAVLQTAESQRDLKALQAKFAPKQAHLESLNKEVDALRNQLASKAVPLADTDRSAREQSLNTKDRQLQREAEDLKNDSEGAAQQAFQVVAQKVYSFVQTYASKHGYTLVIERGSDTAPVVWYAGKDVDMTDQIIKAYNLEATLPAVQGSSGAPALPSSPSPH